MDEMLTLEEFRAAVAPPDDAVLARARAQMLDCGMAGQGGRRAWWPRLSGTRPRLALTGLAAVAAAAAVSVALVAPGSTPTRSAAMTAKELAYRAAAAAAAQPAVAPGQWVYWRETTEPYRATYQVWATADSTTPAYILRQPGLAQPGQVPAASIRLRCANQFQLGPCQVVGHPGLLTFLGGRDMLGQFGGQIPVSYAGLSSLPRNPLALDRYFGSLHLAVQQSAANREFRIIEDLLISYVMPPALTAELYRALGDVPGVTVNNHAVDVAGRTGLGFQISVPTYPPGPPAYQVDELVINPSTYELMGWQSFLRGQLIGGTAVVKSARVSGPWVVP
jgi:hypothetical protein